MKSSTHADRFCSFRRHCAGVRPLSISRSSSLLLLALPPLRLRPLSSASTLARPSATYETCGIGGEAEAVRMKSEDSKAYVRVS